jgi:hypothetical protein
MCSGELRGYDVGALIVCVPMPIKWYTRLLAVVSLHVSIQLSMLFTKYAGLVEFSLKYCILHAVDAMTGCVECV